jgi:hypothetical protein
MKLNDIEAWLVALADPIGPRAKLPGAPLGEAGLKQLVALAERHGVLPAVVRNLRRVNEAGPGPPLPAAASGLEEADRLLIASTGHMLMMRHQLAAVREAFARRAMPLLVIKGPALADRLYAEPAMRTFTDLDLLVPRDGWNGIGAVMDSIGYVPKTESDKRHRGQYAEKSWYPPDGNGGAIDIHWDVVTSPGLRRRVSITYEDLERAFPGGEKTCSAALMLLIAAVHGAAGHRFERLQILCDVSQAARVLPGNDREGLVEAARATGATFALVTALGLAHALFGEPRCGEILTWLAPSRRRRAAARVLTPLAVVRRRGLLVRPRRQAFRELLKHA